MLLSILGKFAHTLGNQSTICGEVIYQILAQSEQWNHGQIWYKYTKININNINNKYTKSVREWNHSGGEGEVSTHFTS